MEKTSSSTTTAPPSSTFQSTAIYSNPKKSSTTTTGSSSTRSTLTRNKLTRLRSFLKTSTHFWMTGFRRISFWMTRISTVWRSKWYILRMGHMRLKGLCRAWMCSMSVRSVWRLFIRRGLRRFLITPSRWRDYAQRKSIPSTRSFLQYLNAGSTSPSN